MTEKQRKFFYFPAWNKCVHANDWFMVKGRMHPDARRSDRAEEFALVWTLAQQLAQARHAGITPDDLRHACHIVALGRDKSSDALTNQEVNRVVCFFEYLTQPENLDAIAKWQNPLIAERESMKSFIRKKAPEEYICAITRPVFGTIWWEDLDLQKLRWLAGQLAHRQNTWKRPVAAAPLPAPARATVPAPREMAECPF